MCPSKNWEVLSPVTSFYCHSIPAKGWKELVKYSISPWSIKPQISSEKCFAICRQRGFGAGWSPPCSKARVELDGKTHTALKTESATWGDRRKGLWNKSLSFRNPIESHEGKSSDKLNHEFVQCKNLSKHRAMNHSHRMFSNILVKISLWL